MDRVERRRVRGAQLGKRRIGSLAIPRDQDDARTLPGQIDGRDFADARRASGDDDRLALHRCPPGPDRTLGTISMSTPPERASAQPEPC
jgi:hypothetical protein